MLLVQQHLKADVKLFICCNLDTEPVLIERSGQGVQPLQGDTTTSVLVNVVISIMQADGQDNMETKTNMKVTEEIEIIK